MATSLPILARLFGECGHVNIGRMVRYSARRWRGRIYCLGGDGWFSLHGDQYHFEPRSGTPLGSMPWPKPSVATKPHRCDIVITLRQARELLDFFGGSDCEVTVMHRNAGEVKDEDDTADILAALPATAPELAAHQGSTVRRINAILQWQRSLGHCKPTDNKVRPTTRQRGRWPALWIRQTQSQ